METGGSSSNASKNERRYLRSSSQAARDLILIVLGVLLALAADAWRESRQDRKAELALLRAMQVALTSDRGALEEGVAGFERAEAANLTLQQHLADGKPYSSSLDALFGLVYATGVVAPLNVAPYEALKARGLQLVEDEPLRLQIAAVYENTYGEIRRQNEFNVGVVFDVLRPYYLASFRDLHFGERATPLNYEALRADPLFMNILVYRADFVRRAVIEPYEEAIGQIDSLIAVLDGKLSAQ